MLKKSAAEAEQTIRDSLPAPAECEHEFSPSFQRKMRRTFRYANHSFIYKLPKYAACFVLVVTLVSGTWLTVDAEARSAFFAWVREQYETYIEYRFVGRDQTGNADAQYTPTWLPEGFSMLKCNVTPEETHIIYENDSGVRLTFLFLREADALSMFLSSDYEETHSVQLGNTSAEFYQATQDSDANALVWIEDDMCFCITGAFPEETLLKVAKNVTKNNF